MFTIFFGANGVRSWTVGKPRPLDYRSGFMYDTQDEGPKSYGDITVFKATGDELDYILRNFRSIPYLSHNKGETVWRGTWAQFIYDNIDNVLELG